MDIVGTWLPLINIQTAASLLSSTCTLNCQTVTLILIFIFTLTVILCSSRLYRKVEPPQASSMWWQTIIPSSACCTLRAAAMSEPKRCQCLGPASTKETASSFSWERWSRTGDRWYVTFFFYMKKGTGFRCWITICSIFSFWSSLWNARTSTTGLAVNATTLSAWQPPSWPFLSETMSNLAAVNWTWSMKALSRKKSLRWAFFSPLFIQKRCRNIYIYGYLDNSAASQSGFCINRSLDPGLSSHQAQMIWPLTGGTRTWHLSTW